MDVDTYAGAGNKGLFEVKWVPFGLLSLSLLGNHGFRMCLRASERVAPSSKTIALMSCSQLEASISGDQKSWSEIFRHEMCTSRWLETCPKGLSLLQAQHDSMGGYQDHFPPKGP